jgi:hypothetical protein
MTSLPRSPLRRFVTDGLRDTIDAYTTATLPLHRFAWELDSRLDTLTELTGLPHWRTLNALRDAQRIIAAVDTEVRAAGGTALTAAEEHTLTTAVATLRTALARLDPRDPVDPLDPARPLPVAIAPPVHRRTRPRTGARRILVA